MKAHLSSTERNESKYKSRLFEMRPVGRLSLGRESLWGLWPLWGSSRELGEGGQAGVGGACPSSLCAGSPVYVLSEALQPLPGAPLAGGQKLRALTPPKADVRRL